jgi:hypothetical protein
MISVLSSSAVDREFKPRSGETKDYEIGICCFSAKYAALRGKSKDWLVRNQDNVGYNDIMTVPEKDNAAIYQFLMETSFLL